VRAEEMTDNDGGYSCQDRAQEPLREINRTNQSPAQRSHRLNSAQTRSKSNTLTCAHTPSDWYSRTITGGPGGLRVSIWFSCVAQNGNMCVQKRFKLQLTL
jgi:hypothetical protein